MVFFLLGPINPLEGLLGVLVCAPPPRVNVRISISNPVSGDVHHGPLRTADHTDPCLSGSACSQDEH